MTLGDSLWPEGNRGDPYQLIVLIENDDNEDEGKETDSQGKCSPQRRGGTRKSSPSSLTLRDPLWPEGNRVDPYQLSSS